jgi:alkyl sulfatase BDS1-like metallo-beta-lactamase superfamily hydrolase
MTNLIRVFYVRLLVVVVFMATAMLTAQQKDATNFTNEKNKQVLDQLPFSDKSDFERSKKGFIASLEIPIIQDASGKVVYDLTQYNFLMNDTPAPSTVNPSLWRQSQLLTIHGLFKVTDHIYQVRNYDLANISFIEGTTGWIVIDPLTATETAKASLDFINKHVGKKPVVAVIYTHSHADHFGGVKGVISEEDVKDGKVKVIAPEGFFEEAVSENLMAGNVMGRRASYMYGNLLPKDSKGNVGGGLGVTTAAGTFTIIEPTDVIFETGTKMTVDGIEIVFQNTPGAEAPAEMMFYFPQFKALCVAEDCNATMHNLYTLRGAKVRDPLAWSKYINEAIELFGDGIDLIFGTHHWPRWGKEECINYLKKQRDLYKYIHDQTLRLANHGYTMYEIAEMLELPESLKKEFYNRGYYGSLNHNVKAVYQRYLGWFDGNPANLHSLPPVESGKKYVEFMGGVDEVIRKARESYDNGEYRWVAQLMNHVVFAFPKNQEAKNLAADALEQLGYQAESGPWRNFYLSGAKELRGGVKIVNVPVVASPDMTRALPLETFFDYMAIRLNGPGAEGKTIKINLNFPDIDEKYSLTLENSVLNYSKDKLLEDVDASININRSTLNSILLGETTLKDEVASGEVSIDGEAEALAELLLLMDNFNFWFNIVTP